MLDLNRSGVIGLASAAAALAGVLAVGSVPMLTGLIFVAVMVAALAAVALTAQLRRFGDESRLVYRPVYVRTQNGRRQTGQFNN